MRKLSLFPRVAAENHFAVGVALVLATTFFFACMDASAKALAERFDPLFVVWARYAGQALIAVLIFLPTLSERLKTDRIGFQIFRSALLFSATIMFFNGFATMPLADVISVAQVAPLAITALAAIWLGEKVGPWRWFGVALGFFGALIILRPGFSGVGWAALFPLFGALFFAAYSVATRMLGASDDPWTTFLYTGSVGAIAATLIVPFVWTTPAWSDAPLLLAIGVFGGLGQGALIFAFGFAPASALAPFIYSGLVWSIAFGWVFFSEFPDYFTFVGAGVIVGAGLFVRWREAVRARRSA